uniref:BHLH domain-containing protein n=1 Tax=Leptobrachium leishanense TaxID=445787 RepID=A0A8C5QI59_9ANUR
MEKSIPEVFDNRTPFHSMALPWGFRTDHGDIPLVDPYGISLHFDPSSYWDRRLSGHFSCFPFQRHLRLCDYSLEPAYIRKRNERERQRVRCVNEGYARLRQHLPQDMAEKRLSKVETLRAAIGYIKRLQGLLDLESLGSSVNENLAENAPHSFLHPAIECNDQVHYLKDATQGFCKEEDNS